MCGIFGAYEAKKAAELTWTGLHWEQHRASEYCGIATSDRTRLYWYKGAGRVHEVLSQRELDLLHGTLAIGHVRYSTVEDDEGDDNAQPLIMEDVALAHNGNLTNLPELKAALPDGVRMKTTIDTEIILIRYHLATGSPTERIVKALDGVRGTYTLIFLLRDRIIAVCDRYGNRPISLGHRNGSYFVASETCAFDSIQAETIRDIEPGEILTIDSRGLTSERLPGPYPPALARCVFERIYYAFPTSVVFGEPVADFRHRLGRKLEEVCPTPNGEVVIDVPDSARFIADGYAESGRSGRRATGLLRHHDVPRSFIKPTQALRNECVARKFAVNIHGEQGIKGRRVVVVDDSIVRLTTMPQLMQALQWAGAKEVHVRIGCPPIKFSCRSGIDTPIQQELAAANMTVDEMRRTIGADSLEFLPLLALQELVSTSSGHCFACMNGIDPINPTEETAK